MTRIDIRAVLRERAVRRMSRNGAGGVGAGGEIRFTHILGQMAAAAPGEGAGPAAATAPIAHRAWDIVGRGMARMLMAACRSVPQAGPAQVHRRARCTIPDRIGARHWPAMSMGIR